MAKRGRKPTPEAIKDLTGTAQACRKRSSAPRMPAALAMVAPAWLSRDAKSEWKRVVPLLEQSGILADADQAMLASYCSIYGEFVESRRRRIPLVASVVQQMRVLADSFGLTPGGRAGLKLDGKKNQTNNFDRNARAKAAATLRDGGGAVLPGNSAGPSRVM